jgi:hypothetical protein
VTLLTGCAAQRPYLSAGNAGLGQNPYQIGPVTVVVRSQPEVAMICRLSAPSLKHHFEGGWHDLSLC